MASLYELTDEIAELLELLEEEEENEEEINKILQGLTKDFEGKFDGYMRAFRNIEGQIAGVTAEYNRLKDRKDALKKKQERIKKSLLYAMQTIGKDRIETELFSATVRNNAPVLVIDDESAVPKNKNFLIEQPPIIDKKAINKELKGKNDAELPEWCHREKNQSIILK